MSMLVIEAGNGIWRNGVMAANGANQLAINQIEINQYYQQ